jgi:large subunit ribosomal protein L18
MDAQKRKHKRQSRRKHHVRSKITGTSEKPRLSVFRSSKHIYAQLIDDINGVTLASASTAGKEAAAATPYGGNVKAAAEVGKKLGEAATAKGIKSASFDRGHFRFHGRIKALAEAATNAGLMCTDPKANQEKMEASKAKKPAPEAKVAKPKGGEKPKGEKKKK